MAHLLSIKVPLAPMGLYPTMGTLAEVFTLAESKLPITTKNDVVALLMTYHNTLLHQLQKDQPWPTKNVP